MKKDGSLDWRCKENRKLLGTNEKGQPVNVTGTPDRRFKETKDEHARGQSSSKSGRTPSIAPVKKYVGTGEDEVDSRIHKPASTRKDEVDSPIAREPDYNAYLNDLREASQAGFDDLCNKANQLQPHIPPLTMKKKGKFCLNIDESSQKRIPTGKLNGDYVALRTSGDGNCFFRTASVLAFGDESKHLEMRVRIVVELACNIQYHLTVPNVEERIRVIEEYLLGTSSSKALDTSLIKVAFKGEVRETCKQFNSASHWHVEALPTVIRRPVKVVFPEGSGRIEEIFNDDIHPRDGRLILEPLVIMWTSANPSPRGGPDHFVPLVPAGEVCSPGKDLWRQYEDVLAQSQSQPTREQIKPTTSFQETTV
ncbi:unnamed protein product [Pocillopora meandrina]|uniref:Vertnin n=1 Tax=Pocillopora meandrina TaxID=46732 RepID=A0AAU9XBC4_9CNID|nr:unnamed protein product [Pocillopora meandrina]